MTITPTYTIQLFEHQTLRLGEVVNGVIFDKSTLKALALYHEKHGGKYYSLVYEGIKFKQYVGVLQVGKLTIEILPKADKASKGDTQKWQAVLLEMLRSCKLIKTEVAGIGQLRLQSNSILDLYFELFLGELGQLLHKGLPKKYTVKENNQKTLKGRLHLPTQLRKNALHPERFYVRHNSFDYDHLFNQVLHQALQVLRQVYLKTKLVSRLNIIISKFPKVTSRAIRATHFEQLFSINQYRPHHTLLEIARLLILNFSPDIRAGQHHLLAVLFDMNVLYEEYIFRQLKKLEKDRISVSRQQAKPFWQRRSIRPDILLKIGTKNYVLDTKWKILKNNAPSMEDLKQLYIYCQYFDAEQGILLYPKVYETKNTAAIPFRHSSTTEKRYSVQVLFLDILDEKGGLNKKISDQILFWITNA